MKIQVSDVFGRFFGSLVKHKRYQCDAADDSGKGKGGRKPPSLSMGIHDADPHPHQCPPVRLSEDSGQKAENDQGNENVSHVCMTRL